MPNIFVYVFTFFNFLYGVYSDIVFIVFQLSLVLQERFTFPLQALEHGWRNFGTHAFWRVPHQNIFGTVFNGVQN